MHYQLKITLQDIDPAIWRRVLVPSDYTLMDLHHVIQLAMGWEDCHLFEFTIKRQRYGDGFEGTADGGKVLLCDVVRSRSKFVYEYDFGDGWNHELVVEKVVHDAEVPGPICVEGERACPPEECGGPWGYAQKLEALSSPDDDEESEELRDWIGADFDSELFDVGAINKELQSFFRPRPRKAIRSRRQSSVMPSR